MKKIFLLMIFCFSVSAEEQIGYKGCGEYLFQGKLVQDKKDKAKFVYVVNEGTFSEMTFVIPMREDFLKIAAYLKQPTRFQGFIFHDMDGTKGEVKNLSRISLRYPNPLVPTKDTFIQWQKTVDCEKKL